MMIFDEIIAAAQKAVDARDKMNAADGKDPTLNHAAAHALMDFYSFHVGPDTWMEVKRVDGFVDEGDVSPQYKVGYFIETSAQEPS